MSPAQSSSPPRCSIAVIGRGRLGGALSAALQRAGYPVRGPLGRSYAAADVAGAAIVLLCVPDREIAGAAATAAAHLAAGSSPPSALALVGHCSGATGLQTLLDATGGAVEVFSLHPLMTVGAGDHAEDALAGAAAAVAGSGERARLAAAALASALGMQPVVVEEEDRAAYHAAASIASNFLVTLEVAAERLAATAGLERAQLAPLVRQTVANWGSQGADALTGPIARGDEQTVARQRAAVAQRTPELLALFDALAAATRSLGRAVPA